MPPDIDLDALTALEQAATPAPWTADVAARGDCVLWGPNGQFVANAQSEPHWLPAADGGKRAVMFDVDRRDVAFIEAARNNWSALLSALTATRAELEQARAEIERLKVERGEALLWSPWNDHDVLFEQWAKRRGGAGNEASCDCHPLVPQDFKDAVAKTAAERYPEKYGALAAGAGDGEQDTATCGHTYIGNVGEFTCTLYAGHNGNHWNSLAEFGWTADSVDGGQR